MKKILSFLSIILLLASCSNEEPTNSNLTSDISTELKLVAPILELSEHIQTSQNEHIEVESVSEILTQVDGSKIRVVDNNEFIVELGLSFTNEEIELLKKQLVEKYNIPLTDKKLTSWYLHSASGKELEISLIESGQESTLRFLMRAYL